MTAPELVEVVAEVLAEHSGVVWDSLGTAVFCSDCLDGDEPAPFGDADKWLAQHQARAVLAALTEAGEVEWGVAWKGAGPGGVLAFDSEEDAREAVELGGLLSRLTLPWGRAE